jgi:CPA2 family monovalent cation:H+ antiporter-2
VIVRTIDDADIEQLRQVGAAEVVADIMEGSLMLASHTMVLLGVPLNRVLRRIRDTREQRYSLLRGFFHGVSDEVEDAAQGEPRLLHSVLITPGAAAIARTVGQLAMDRSGVEIKAVRQQHGAVGAVPTADTVIHEGDVIVLLGTAQDCTAAEMKLMQGGG